ncbi:di-trans,poly-cis-decaprenylcistransferase [Spinellus fusiger]|nr:di-trans,poly-cis-decaprenylcistransferase [Spinellus fusiger]
MQFNLSLQDSFDYCYNFWENAMISILTKGKMPRHVGFILDGNRRFARKTGNDPLSGHNDGCRQLEKVIALCMRLNIKALTMYAFSTENFNRPKEEVDYLMKLFVMTFRSLREQSDFVSKFQVGIRFLGNVNTLPTELRDIILSLEDFTKDNDRCILNICCPYTSREEMTHSIQRTVQLVQEEKMNIEEINASVLNSQLFTAECPPLDIIVRTSGEIRLSDFLLWQASHGCQIQFVDCLWPEFSLRQFLPILLEYQLYSDHIHVAA